MPEPAPVRLKLLTDPPGAVVEIQGQTLGATPVDYTLEGDTPVLAVFSLQGFEAQRAELTRASAPELTIKLARKRPVRKPPSGGLGIKTDR